MRGRRSLSQVRRGLAQVKRQRWADERDYWLRRLGYFTRPLVYFAAPVLLALWLVREVSGLILTNFSVKDLLLVGGALVALLGGTVPLALFYFNIGEEIRWEAWGRFGALLAAVALGAFGYMLLI